MSVVACPEASQTLRKQGLLTSRPPSTKPGEPLEVVNHDLGTRTVLVRPTSKAAAALPKWLPYAAGLFLVADFGSGFMDANLPTLIAGGAAAAGASFVGGNQFLVPRLKQLPQSSVRRPALARPQNTNCRAGGCVAHAARDLPGGPPCCRTALHRPHLIHWFQFRHRFSPPEGLPSS